MEQISRKQKRINLCLTSDEVGTFTGMSTGTVSYYENDIHVSPKNIVRLDKFYTLFKYEQDQYLKAMPPIERNEQYITGSQAAKSMNIPTQRFNRFNYAKFILGIATGIHIRQRDYIYHPNDILMLKYKRQFIIQYMINGIKRKKRKSRSKEKTLND